MVGKVTDIPEEGYALNVGVTHTAYEPLVVGHRGQLLVTPDEIFQVEFSSNKEKAFHNVGPVYQEAMRYLKDKGEFASHLRDGIRALYKRYIHIPITFNKVPSENKSQAFSEEDYFSPDVWRRRTPGDLVFVTAMTSEDYATVRAENTRFIQEDAFAYNMLDLGADATNCTGYSNILMGQVGLSDADLFGDEKDNPFAYISGNTRRNIARYIQEHDFPVEYLPVPGHPEQECIQVVNLTFKNGVEGTVIINPNLSKHPMEPLDLVRLAHEAGLLRLPHVNQPKLAESTVQEQAECKEREQSNTPLLDSIRRALTPNWLQLG